MLRNRRGATSLRWLRALLDHGIEVRGQVVVCPGVNDGARLDDTFAGILDEYPELATVAVVPLGISRFNPEANLREHTVDEAQAVIDAVEDWQDVYLATLGRRLVHAADEYYLMARRDVPGRRPLRGLPDARGRRRHGAYLRGGVPSAGRRHHRHAAWLLRRRRHPAQPHGLPHAVLERATGRRTSHVGAAALGPDRHPLRRARRPGVAAAGRVARPSRRPRDPSCQRVLRRQHRQSVV